MADLDYNIIVAATRRELVSEVKDAIADGWGLLGSAFIQPMSYGGVDNWCQTLYKDTELVSTKKEPIEIKGLPKHETPGK